MARRSTYSASASILIAALSGATIVAGISMFGGNQDARAQARAHIDPLDLHLDLEMTGYEWRALEQQLGGLSGVIKGNDPLQEVLQLGKRNLDWLAVINAKRPDDSKLELSTPETQRGIPITEPSESNRALVLQRLSALKAEMPASMVDILWSNSPLPNTPTVADELYLEQTRNLDRIYQSASRWLLQEPYLDAYAQRATKDIRGYYFLQQEPNLDGKLQNWDKLNQSDRDRLTEWLLGLCRNAERTLADCRNELRRSVAQAAHPFAFYHRYLASGKSRYDSFFDLQNPRSESEWSDADPDQLMWPFAWPEREDVRLWLKNNIEDEYRLDQWQLQLEFDRYRTGLASIEFIPGATPHVNGLGGDKITMDANRSIAEYSSRWTIRHEFGHVLGLPDCYVEFYDSERGVMINYQIDIEDLMCSRRGRMQPRILEELRKSYYRVE